MGPLCTKVMHMNYTELMTDENRGNSRHSSLASTEKAAYWLEKTISGTLESAEEKTELSKEQIRNAARKSMRKYCSKED